MTLLPGLLDRLLQPTDVFVETGAHYLETTRHAARICGKAFSCDVQSFVPDWKIAEWIRETDVARGGRGDTEIGLTLRPSEEWIEGAVAHAAFAYGIRNAAPVVIFLDAHTESTCPVLKELDGIRRSGVLPRLLLIDDCRYFRRKTWGFGLESVVAAVRAIGPCVIRYEDGHPLSCDPPPTDDLLVADFKDF